MKKIRVLIALAMMVTIGGVYATWNYAEKQAMSVQSATGVTLTEKVADSEKGVISFNNTLGLVIDDTNADYVAELSATGSATVTFEPSEFAPLDVRNNGIKMKCEVSVTEPWTYEGDQIFTVVSPSIILNNGEPTREVTITADELMNALTLGPISLDTEEKYDLFAEALKSGEITLTISEEE